jgi:xanthine dehydrogenase small subunit
VIRATRTEEVLRGRALDAAAADAAAAALAAEIAPIDDIRSTARYRARVAVNLLREFLASPPPAGGTVPDIPSSRVR